MADRLLRITPPLRPPGLCGPVGPDALRGLQYDGPMLAWRKVRKARAPARGALLGAVPLRNALVRESGVAAGLRLSAPLRGGALRRALGAAPPLRQFELDALGAYVWTHIDGRRTVEDLIRDFAADQRVNLREAEVAVLAFLHTLTQRNLVGLRVPGAAP